MKYYVITSDENIIYDYLEHESEFMPTIEGLQKAIDEIGVDILEREKKMLEMEEGEEKEEERAIVLELKEMHPKLYVAEIDVVIKRMKEGAA